MGAGQGLSFWERNFTAIRKLNVAADKRTAALKDIFRSDGKALGQAGGSLRHKTAPQVVVLAMCDTRDRFSGGLVVHVIHRMEPRTRALCPVNAQLLGLVKRPSRHFKQLQTLLCQAPLCWQSPADIR